jgi:hypothetical protein
MGPFGIIASAGIYEFYKLLYICILAFDMFIIEFTCRSLAFSK